MRQTILVIFFLLVAWSLTGIGCDSGPTTYSGDGGSSDGDTDSDTDGDTDGDADSDADAGDGSSPGGPGDDCWTSTMGLTHPNYGMPDCEDALTCIGSETTGFCSEHCDQQGDLPTGTDYAGWCCGLLGNPCDKALYWFPPQLDHECIPRTEPPAATCVAGTEWPSSAVHCAPVCNGTNVVHETACKDAGSGNFFCSFQCDTLGTPCNMMEGGNPGFNNGCCDTLGASSTWCIPEALCP